MHLYHSGRRLVAVAALACLSATTLAACSRGDGSESTLAAFLDGWRSGNLTNVGFVAPDGQSVPAAKVTEEIKSLSGDLAKNPPALRVAQKPKVTKDTATAEIGISWPLGENQAWEYTSTVRLAKDNDKWRVIWEPAIVQHELSSGDKLGIRRTEAQRATILDGTGKPIVAGRPVVVVGVSPQLIKNLPQLTTALDAAFKSVGETVDMSHLPDQVKNAKPDAFIELITLRRPAYDQIRSRIQPLDGTVFREETWQLPPTREFARATIGSVGAVTKEILDANPGKYQEGDQVGLSGLQRQYDTQLRGKPGIVALRLREDPAGKVSETKLWERAPEPGKPIKTTLDPAVQTAADNALRAQPKRSALVAIRVSDGSVLALANGPDGGGVNLALTAQVPPGSTFKMVSTVGLLDAGAVAADTIVPCPQTFTVGGRSFKNSDNFVLGNVPFHTDFAKSCNTAFTSLAPKLGDNGLAEAGKTLGLGVPWDLGVEAYSGKVSTGGSDEERAAAIFGQGTTLVSPIALAAATAGVARGQWQQPKLMVQPAPAKPAVPGPQLKQSTVDPLRAMMREVVTAGTGTALAHVPGQPVYGKSGTAEFDSADPSKTHAWFVGWQGDIAFAVFVENGGGGSATAVPLAQKFLTALPRG